MITIRPFEMKDEDYQLAVEVNNAVWVEYPETIDEWKISDENRSRATKWGRFFAEIDGQTVGYAHYTQSLWLNHPGKLWVDVLVLPVFRNRGIGTALWHHLCREIEQFDPLRLLTTTREDYTEGVRFAKKMDFTERMREWESRLDTPKLSSVTADLLRLRMCRAGHGAQDHHLVKSDSNRGCHVLDWADQSGLARNQSL